MIKKMSFVVLLLVSLLPLCRHLFAATRDVPSPDYPTIQSGIDAASAGDTVSVAFGTYTGKVVIKKDGVTLEGAGAGRTFLNRSGIEGVAITFENVTGSTIRGFTIKKAATGIVALNSKPYITNNIFYRNTNAVESRSSSYSRIINNTFHGNTKAVFNNSSSTLINNIISGSGRYGFVGTKAGSITYNLFNGNVLGNYSGISAPPDSMNNIAGSPLFVNFTSDFHLSTGSPAIKKGDPSLKNSFNNLTSDIGAYGGPNADVTPATVKGVSVASYIDKVTLSWDKNPAYNIAGYNVYYRISFGSYTSSVSAGDVSSIELTAPTLTPETRYYFSVRTIDSSSTVHEGLDSAEVFGAIDNTAPLAPTGLSADIGDRRLYLSWSAATDGDPFYGSGVKGYNVYYGTAPGSYNTPIDVGNITSYELTGLTNGVTYYIAVSAYDNVIPAPNEGTKSAEVSESPEEIRGIMGLKNTGGCFIATAAYGSYEERHVKVLREFRDKYLIANCKLQIANFKIEIPNILGRAFVSTYYKISPPVADFIRDSGTLRFIVRSTLLPLIGFAWMSINYPWPFVVFLGLVAVFGIFRVMGVRPYAPTGLKGCVSRLTSYVSLLTILFSLSLPAASLGDERSGPSFGISYGRLEPASDEWKEIYSDERTTNYRALLGYRFNRILGVEIGGGYLTKNGKGKTFTGRDTGVETTFQLAPVDITLLCRLNYFPEQFIIPYIGGGLSYNLYRESVKDGRGLKGSMWGHNITGGIQLLLDRFDKKSARDLEEDYGINNTYLVISGAHSVINDFGKEEVDLGGWNYTIGLLFEF